MHLNLKGWKDQLKQKAELAKFLYRNFRIYDFGSYALNRLTPKQGYTVQKNVPYGLKARLSLCMVAHGCTAIKKITASLAKLLPKKALMLP